MTTDNAFGLNQQTSSESFGEVKIEAPKKSKCALNCGVTCRRKFGIGRVGIGMRQEA